MTGERDRADEKLLSTLKERAKELNCLYDVEEILGDPEAPMDQVFWSVVEVLPRGFRFPEVCRAEIVHGGRTYSLGDVGATPWVLSAPIRERDQVVGSIRVLYVEERPAADEGPFLEEEGRLIATVAERLGHHLKFRRLREMRQVKEEARGASPERDARRWRGPMMLLRRSDRDLYMRIARKMLNHLCWIGVDAARDLLSMADRQREVSATGETNQPMPRSHIDDSVLMSDEPFELASSYLDDEEILEKVEQWIQADRVSFFSIVLDNPRSSLREVVDALRRFHNLVDDGAGLPSSTVKGLRAALVRRFLSEQLEYVMVAKEYVTTRDFEDLLGRVIAPSGGQIRVGGKAAGLILASLILDREVASRGGGSPVQTPRTWYLASSGLIDFIRYNDLQDLVEQKYKPIEQVRSEYPNVVQLYKNSSFPPDMVRDLSAALDDMGDRPLIVRSSSLLEDRLGTAFSGKYKSLFLPNTGDRKQRMEALLDAIAEIYASTIGPDPIEYRREHGLLDFNEEMGVLIQPVVGVRTGRYFLPAFAGVAFSRNEMKWSPRIKREDGLIRLVPGLGTRAVDRLGDDYPVLAAPGQPGLRVNATIDEVVRYSPKKIDVIDLETGTFVTLPIRDLLAENASSYPAFDQVFSVLEGDMLSRPRSLMVDPGRDELVATFDGLLGSSRFVEEIAWILDTLEQRLGWPVDIEFAHDGKEFFLLQCRPQSYGKQSGPSPIPRDVPEEDVVFTARKHVSNGRVADVTHIVHVDPDAYSALEDRSDMLAVGRAVSRLNKLLPKRQFILMGPGRWGSRGDIKLGVNVTYSDISNAAMLIEIARRKGSYVPDLSFGTHFFQDLVESGIRYLPLYPDDEGVLYNHGFLSRSPNLLPQMAPEFAHVERVVRVIDVPASSHGRILRVLLNADIDEAMGFLAGAGEERPAPGPEQDRPSRPAADHWIWRLSMAEHIASRIDPARFGVEAVYLFGSTKNATAGPSSDIDLLVHFRGSEEQRRDLVAWMEGWSLCLARMNYMRTGCATDGLLDVQMVTDEDIERRSGYAGKIDAVTDPARKLAIGG